MIMLSRRDVHGVPPKRGSHRVAAMRQAGQGALKLSYHIMITAQAPRLACTDSFLQGRIMIVNASEAAQFRPVWHAGGPGPARNLLNASARLLRLGSSYWARRSWAYGSGLSLGIRRRVAPTIRVTEPEKLAT